MPIKDGEQQDQLEGCSGSSGSTLAEANYLLSIAISENKLELARKAIANGAGVHKEYEQLEEKKGSLQYHHRHP